MHPLSVSSALPPIARFVGMTRQHCQQQLHGALIDSVDFGHWLLIPSLKTLLVFRHQHCVAVDLCPTL